ncbi:MAG: polysaccharide export protein [Deltaproteobacteria bacterium]|nr:polysaccharide export protein [Deltaproteobacteria bacterium]
MKQKRATIILTFLIVCLLAGSPVFAGEASDLASEEQNQPRQTYIIGTGDVLEITTWKEEDFTRDNVPVRLDGMITFPLIGDIRAEGRTTMQVKAVIEEKLKDYIESPNVTVHLRAAFSKKFYILGEVMKTGEYPMIKNYTVLQAFALAGGFTEWASKKEILLLRKVDGQDKIIRINYKQIVKGNDFGQNVQIQADDTIIVP